MKITGAAFSVALVAVAGVGVITAFVDGASPYVTIKEARHISGDNLHLVGDIDKRTVQTDLAAREITFDLKDTNGETIKVVYSGPAPGNLSTATRIVAVGGLSGNEFRSNRLLIKCPSKYEGEKKGA